MVLQKDYWELLLIVDDVDPYNKEAADQAAISGYSYAYMAGTLVANGNDTYLYAYTLGDDSMSSIGAVEYSNVLLKTNTVNLE